MKTKILHVCFLLVLGSYGFLSAQLANVNYTVRTDRVTSYENASGGACWEGGTEEYTAYVYARDNVNGSESSTGCRTCNNNGNCTYATDVYLHNRTSNAYTIFTRINAWEDDRGSRCSYDCCSAFRNDDDCRRTTSNQAFDFREASLPSTGTYGFSNTFGGTNNHTWRIKAIWRYSGSASRIYPQCYAQNVNEASGAIRSHSVYLTAGRTYRFQTTSGPDTYLRLFGSNGYTLVASNDDGGAGLLSLLTYTPSSTGFYYIETSQYSRNQLGSNSNLQYQDMTPNPGNPAVFGNNSWNVYAYNGRNINLSGISYYGYYTESALSFNSLNRWGTSSTPAAASGYQGCDPGIDQHTVVYKRRGFPCGQYRLSMPNHDDEVRVYVNGSQVFEHIGCCDSHSSIWTGCLNSSSTIELRWAEGGGGSHGSLSFTNLSSPPTIASCPGNRTVSANGNCQGTTTWNTPSASDECGIASLQRIAGPASGSAFGLGNTTVTYRATDNCGQTATCSFNVAVVDNSPPSISCPSNITVNAANGICGRAVSYSTPSGSDNCPSVSTSRIGGLASGSTFPVGTTTNTFRATAGNGQTATCSFTVTVIDNQAPTISCPSNITVNADLGTCSNSISYSTPVGTDNCPGASTTQIAGLGSGASFSVGTTTNTFRVTAGGGTATCSFTVTVIDNQAPTISCPSNITVNAANGQCGAVVSYSNPEGLDNCPGVVTTQTAGLSPGSTYPVGTTTNSYTASGGGGSATCSFTVTVVDNQAPTISCPSNITVNNTAGLCSGVATFIAPVGGDNCPGATTAQTAGLGSGASYPVGTTTNTFTVTAAGNATASCSFTVTVVDNEAPTITCPANISVNNTAGLCSGTATYVAPVGGDNCPGASTAQTAGLASGATYAVGTTTNTFTVTSSNGQTASCSFTVTVVDNEAPNLTCPGNVTLAADASCQATVPNFVQSFGSTVLANSSTDFFGGQGYRNWYYGQYFANSSNNFSVNSSSVLTL